MSIENQNTILIHYYLLNFWPSLEILELFKVMELLPKLAQKFQLKRFIQLKFFCLFTKENL